MEPNAMSGGIFSNIQPGGMLGLEMSLHHPLRNPQNSHFLQNPHQHMLNYGHHDENYHHPQTQQPAKQAHPVSTKSKAQTLTLSDDEEPADNSADDGKRKMISPWQRMKWTDNMVRLLIMVVFYIGDEFVSEANNDSKKRCGGGGGGGGILQKKGKWKSVSRAMMEKGFYVSPQQCEDKFNDLNKRYKRVNDILGKGISCRVVENQTLLDTMDHLSPKLKEEVRKLLNSKHLFFREMCAYHNGCGHGSGGAGGGVQAEPPPPAAQPQRCLQSPKNVNNNAVPNLIGGDNEGAKPVKRDDDDGDDDDNDEDDDGDAHDDGDEDDDDDDDDDGIDDDDVNFSDNERSSSRKRLKKGWSFNSSPLIQQLDLELANILQDGSKSQAEKRQWMKTNMIRLEEQRMGLQSQSFEIEKQRLKWLKFSSKKEREMERERLANERLRLENERMVLIVRQKELDLIDHHHRRRHMQQQLSSNRKSDPSLITG